MKKCIIILIIVIIGYIVIGQVFATNNIIPDEAIRIRVIANSNSDYDQKIKYKVKDVIEKDMYNILKDTKNIEEARTNIEKNLTKEEKNIKTLLDKEGYNLPFKINFGYNYFPNKEFKGIKYKEGYYESVVVTLGEGLGDNWWCVLFPPLCMIEAEESDNVTYTTAVRAIVDKYF